MDTINVHGKWNGASWDAYPLLSEKLSTEETDLGNDEKRIKLIIHVPIDFPKNPTEQDVQAMELEIFQLNILLKGGYFDRDDITFVYPDE